MSEIVDLDELSKDVENKLKSFGYIVPYDTPKLIKEIGNYFNESISRNEKVKPTKLIVIPAKTGTSKSLTAKIYISMLKTTASIIVVKTAKEALEYCENINEFKGDDNYARCYYTISGDNPDRPLRVEKKYLTNFRCIVITHKMFIDINKSSDISLFDKFKGKKRDFIVIDERFNFLDTTKINLVQIKRFYTFVCDIKKELFLNTIDKSGVINKLKKLINVINCIKEYKTFEDEKLLFKKTKAILTTGLFTDFIDLIENSPTLYKNIYFNDPIFKIEKEISNQSFIKKIKELISSIELLFKHDFLYDKNKDEVVISKRIDIKFGSAIILDATANINARYIVSEKLGKIIEVVNVTNPRRYDSLKINICDNGTKQSKSYLTDKNNIIDNQKYYKNVIESILTDPKDKILVVTHKDFLEGLEKTISDSRVNFTNYGKHVGRNDWSDCNKVIIIGWLRLAQIETVFDMISFINEKAFDYDLSEIKKEYTKTGIVDDLVQASMRGSARLTSNINGDCSKCEIYLFEEKTPLSDEIINTFLSEFPYANVNRLWEPKIKYKVKRGKVENKILKILDYLDIKLNHKSDEVLTQEVINNLGISKTTLGRIISDENFKSKLASKKYEYIKSGRRKIFRMIP